MNSMCAVIVTLEDSSKLKFYLKNETLYDEDFLCKRVAENELALPVKKEFFQKYSHVFKNEKESFDWKKLKVKYKSEVTLPKNPKKLSCTPLKIFKNKINNENVFNEILYDLPASFEKFEDLLLFPTNCLKSSFWNDQNNLLLLAEAYNCKRIAVKNAISNDDFRTPKVQLRLGSNNEVNRVENNIKYHLNLQYNMFSQGNITEKMRISARDCSQETIVDLYAGIGYFTLSYLKHARCKLLYACEWNKHAVDALRTNLKLNNILSDHCVILYGDCNQVCPCNIADRVNLGLLPSSEGGWLKACGALKWDKGGVLHIHGNVRDDYKDVHKDVSDACFHDERSKNNNMKMENSVVSNISCNKSIKKSWIEWAMYVEKRITTLMKAQIRERPKFKKASKSDESLVGVDELSPESSKQVKVRVVHVEHVKSFAPRVDHMVADVVVSYE